MSFIDSKMYECSHKAKHSLNGIVLIYNVLSRVLRRNIIYSDLFNSIPNNNKDNNIKQ